MYLDFCNEDIAATIRTFNGLIIQTPTVELLEDPFDFQASRLQNALRSVSSAERQERPSLIIFEASNLKLDPEKRAFFNEEGNLFSLEADTEVVQTGAIPGVCNRSKMHIRISCNADRPEEPSINLRELTK